MKDFSATFSSIIDSYKDDMISMLCDLVSFPSVQAAPEDGMPFGKAVDDCLRYALDQAAKIGMNTEYVDGYAGHADIGSGEKTMGILVHLDVVPAGEGWDTDPFTPVIKDGKIFGRGANDNKVASVASLFAIKACLEAGVDFKKKLRVIFGCNEESGWEDIAYYKTKFEMPDFGISPDASFPVINAEKGILHFEITIPMTDDDKKILELSGGERGNVVLAQTKTLLEGSPALDISGFDAQASIENGNTLLTVSGQAAHGSRPDLGINAGAKLVQLLRKNGFSGNAIDFLCDCIGEKTDGSGFDVQFSDEVSGALTLSLGILEKAGDSIRAVIDVRHPVTCTHEDVIEIIDEKCELYGAKLKVIHEHPSLYMQADHPLIKTLLEQYTKTTGQPGYTVSIGGGTYARAMNNAVAFGCNFSDLGDDHGVHMQNEHTKIDDMVKACKVFANVIAAVQDADI